MSETEALSASPLFANLEPAQLERLGLMAERRCFLAGTVILKQHTPVEDFHLILSGQVSLSVDGLTVQTLQSGEVLGWSWLIPPYESHLDAITVTDTETVSLDCVALRAAMDEDHDLGYALLRRAIRPMLERLQSCRLQVLDVYHQGGTR